MTKEIQTVIPKIKEYLATQPVLRAWIFGSCSRGEETDRSDLDILVNYDDSKGVVSLMGICRIIQELEHIAGRRVDLVEEKGLLSFAHESVTHDKILIYER